jgi:hypothetical protein
MTGAGLCKHSMGTSMRTQTDDDRPTDWSVVPAALAFGLGLGAAGWWFTREEPPDVPPRALASAGALNVAPPRAGMPRPDHVAHAASGVVGVVVEGAPLAVAAVAGPVVVGDPALVRAGLIAPVSSPLLERPAFVTPAEWDALHAALAQSAQGNNDGELLHLVRHLRFRKLADAWRGAPQSLPGGLSTRAGAAKAMLDDLLPRLSAGDLDVAEARLLLPDLLADAVPNPNERVQRAQALAGEINRLQAGGQLRPVPEGAGQGEPPPAPPPPRTPP